MAEAFGIACHELVSLDFRSGSTTDSRDLPPPRPVLGEERKSISGDWRSACSQERTSCISEQSRSGSPDTHALPPIAFHAVRLAPRTLAPDQNQSKEIRCRVRSDKARPPS